MAVNPTYFTCTLGQAAELGIQQPEKTVNDFLDARKKSSPDLPVVGFPVPTGGGPWSYRLFTFAELHRGSCKLAQRLLTRLGPHLSNRDTVALLCPSTAEFLFVWLALMRLGCPVLLVAPQCPPAAIEGLCRQAGSGILLVDDLYREQAAQAAQLASESSWSLAITPMPLNATESLAMVLEFPEPVDLPRTAVLPGEIAYLHHTSGTSTGIPKPIPQPHSAAVGALPSFSTPGPSTFTTTPLFHGGIADLLRAWTSSALIWLFPAKSVPITPRNVLNCLQVGADAASQQKRISKIGYFSSVPYVLQMLASDAEGVQALASMEMVGVGGAALSPEIGDYLVQNQVNIVSRYGSAECGFLLSSQRDFGSDREWQYLRMPSNAGPIAMEPREDGLSEVIVRNGWPHMAKQNRGDGYATLDLFLPHPSIPNAWRYHSRADAQLTLITGKKFDPSPLEIAIATHELVEDVLVFGNGKAYPGALLFRPASATLLDEVEFVENIWTLVEKLNQEAPEHARLSKSMLRPILVPYRPLEKSSKGTILRGAAERAFHHEIEAAYENVGRGAAADVPDDAVLDEVRKIVKEAANRSDVLNDTTDLFSLGVDSIASIQIRARLEYLVRGEAQVLPLTVVEDCGTVSGLASYVLRQRRGESVDTTIPDDEREYMRQLVDEHCDFGGIPDGLQISPDRPNEARARVVVLTGATGALGAHVLDQYRRLEDVKTIYCLVRGADSEASRLRVDNTLMQRKLPPRSQANRAEIVVLCADLSAPQLGLDTHTYAEVAGTATHILHLAWPVNFRLRLASFVRDSIAGVNNMVRLALASPSKPPIFGFCSSVAAVSAMNNVDQIPETTVDDPSAASSSGYSKSKWVAEQMCMRACKDTRLAGRVKIFRVGQLAGDTEHGIWNASEAWPLMLRSAVDTRVLPELGAEILNWLPVDSAATALIQGISQPREFNDPSDVTVLHILNPNTTPTWQTMLGWLAKCEDFQTVRPQDWIRNLSALAVSHPEHPSLRLLEHWRRSYGKDGNCQGEDNKPGRPFSMESTKVLVPAMKQVNSVDEEYFLKLWCWIKGGM